jgi:hypothetical protein
MGGIMPNMDNMIISVVPAIHNLWKGWGLQK